MKIRRRILYLSIAMLGFPVMLSACNSVHDSTEAASGAAEKNFIATREKIQELFTYTPRRETPLPVKSQYCYRVMQDVLCYDSPQPGAGLRFVGYQGMTSARKEIVLKPKKLVNTTTKVELVKPMSPLLTTKSTTLDSKPEPEVTLEQNDKRINEADALQLQLDLAKETELMSKAEAGAKPDEVLLVKEKTTLVKEEIVFEPKGEVAAETDIEKEEIDLKPPPTPLAEPLLK